MCLAIEHDLTEAFGKKPWDGSVYRGEQPIYAPTQGAETFTFLGDAVDVETVLRDAPPLEPEHRGAGHIDLDDDPVIVRLVERGLYVRPIGPGVHEIVCPFVGAHSNNDTTGTRYFQAYFGGYKTPNFKCHHHSCEARSKADFLSALELDTGESSEEGQFANAKAAQSNTERWPQPLADRRPRTRPEKSRARSSRTPRPTPPRF